MKYTISNSKRTYLRDGRSPIPVFEITSKVMSANKGKNTSPELRLRKELWNQGLRGYRVQWNKAPGRPDIAFPGKKICIFVNGCFWHRCPYCNLSLPKSHTDFWKAKFEHNIIRDQKKKDGLENLGWRVMVFWECRINSDVNSCIDQIKNAYFAQI